MISTGTCRSWPNFQLVFQIFQRQIPTLEGEWSVTITGEKEGEERREGSRVAQGRPGSGHRRLPIHRNAQGEGFRSRTGEVTVIWKRETIKLWRKRIGRAVKSQEVYDGGHGGRGECCTQRGCRLPKWVKEYCEFHWEARRPKDWEGERWIITEEFNLEGWF